MANVNDLSSMAQDKKTLVMSSAAGSSSFDEEYFLLSSQTFSIIPFTSEKADTLSATKLLDYSTEEISFSGQKLKCCICFIDMINSTRISASLKGSDISRYYSIFLNAMAKIARNFGARIVKNAGDSLIYYFPKTADTANNEAFHDVLECGITMIAAHRFINSKLQQEGLPPLNYRISADFGELQHAKSISSQADDLFGPAINMCAKINSKAQANGMAIGANLYKIVKDFKDFDLLLSAEYHIGGSNEPYYIYSVENKRQRNILNPFKRTSSS